MQFKSNTFTPLPFSTYFFDGVCSICWTPSAKNGWHRKSVSSVRVSFCYSASYWFPLQDFGSSGFPLLHFSLECLLQGGLPPNCSPVEAVPTPAWVTPMPQSLRVVPLQECVSSRLQVLVSLNLLEQGCHMPPQTKTTHWKIPCLVIQHPLDVFVVLEGWRISSLMHHLLLNLSC